MESIGWLEKWQIDDGGRRVFLSLDPEDQTTIRSLGGLKSTVDANKILMGRIQAIRGHVQIPKRHAEDLEETHPSPHRGGIDGCKKYKGEGKGGSLGVPVEEGACQTLCCTAGRHADPTYPTEKVRKFSSQDIENHINGGYYKKAEFAHSINDLQPGGHVLLQGIKTGPNGGESTEECYFHGVFHHWIDWTHASVSSDAMVCHTTVNVSYLIPATEDWVIVPDGSGNVKKEKAVRKTLEEAHLCSWGRCRDKYFNSERRWQMHFDSVHRGKDYCVGIDI